MVQTSSIAKRIELGQGHTVVVSQQDTVMEPSPENGSSYLAPKMKSKDPAAPKKRHRGKPGELCQLNLDILFLIAAYDIHPVDLLNLARTCKSLRELLMNKSSAFVWKSVRQRAKPNGLPECPADLTEPEYANLIYCARCHGCGKYTTAIFWNIRRRYCPNCRARQLRRLSTCAEVVRMNKAALPAEHIVVKKEYNTWCDRDQVALFIQEYREVHDKKRFISDKQKQCLTIRQHAKKCEAWQVKRGSERKHELNRRRLERQERIFDRLQQCGFIREIEFAGRHQIEQQRMSDFKTSRPLTDSEWNRISPEWFKIMESIRLRRLDKVVYQPRLHSLEFQYHRYVAQPPPDAPMLDLLPHVTDLTCFTPFKDILKAPEEMKMNESFASAFAQLPLLVPEWRKKLNSELADLVRIPPQLSPNVTSRQILVSGRTMSVESGLDKLGLACALFKSFYPHAVAYHEVLLTAMPRNTQTCKEDDTERPGSILGRYGIEFLQDAPYIVHECGLDPSTATVDDMNHRNARLMCLCCDKPPNIVFQWKNAMDHAVVRHKSSDLLPLSEFPRWKLVDDKYIDAIQAAEQSYDWEREDLEKIVRCGSCRPRVGDTSRPCDFWCPKHVPVPIGIFDTTPVQVQMITEGTNISFRAL